MDGLKNCFLKASLVLLSILAHQSAVGQQLNFVAPKGWNGINDKTQLPTKVEIVYIGTGKGGFTPSINLATEETTLPIDEYVKLAKSYHVCHGTTKCYELGTLPTPAGEVHLLQIDRKTQWGEVRFLQGLTITNKTAYVLTATCLQEEFTVLYPQFLQAFQTLNFEEPNR